MERIYTLAQSGTAKEPKKPVWVNGKGSEISDPEVIKGRAKRKTISQSLMLNLVDVAKDRKDTKREKAYWNTYHCQNKVVSSDGKLYGNYCKNRFCTLCMSIRKAEMINKYKPIIEGWSNPQFVTLTVRACRARNLQKYMDGMVRAFQIIRERCKKRNQRGNGIPFIGIKSLECNFNPIKCTYNPHYHLIVPDRATADLITSEWLKLWTQTHTYKGAQKIREVQDTERDLIETIKYGSKVFTEPREDIPNGKRTKHTSKAVIYARALDNILKAMQGHRVFDRFGFNLPKTEPQPLEPAKLLRQFDEWKFNPLISDWENTENDEVLASYYPAKELLQMLGFQVDKELE